MEERLPGQRLAELVELGDPAALLRAVDGLRPHLRPGPPRPAGGRGDA